MKTITTSKLSKKLGTFVRVENGVARCGYGEAPNQFILTFEGGEVFQSYNAFIGAKVDGNLYLSKNHGYSRTTSRHCKAWCGLTKQERERGLRNGQITLVIDG